MKNLLTHELDLPVFIAGSFEHDTEYDIEVNGVLKTYRTAKAPEPTLTLGYIDYDCPRAVFNNVLAEGEKPPVYNRYTRTNHKPWKQDVRETIGIGADDVLDGTVKIRKHGDSEWIKPSDIVKIRQHIIIDRDKIKPGQLWKLTIDDDPRFQDTLIMILNDMFERLSFVYQVNVLYPDGFSQTETADGSINLYDRDHNLVDLSAVHLTLVQENTNPGCSMDRTNVEEYTYPSSWLLGYKESYPKVEPRKRCKFKTECDEDCEENYDE